MLLKQARRDYVTTSLEENKGNARKNWRSMNRFMNRGVKGASIKHVIHHDGHKLDGLEAAELVTSYFCSIGADRAIVPTDKRFTTARVRCKFIWKFKISQDEVLKEVNALSDNKSSGFINVNSKVLNLCLKCCIPGFTDLLNLCIDSGIFPNSWKEGIVDPIPKGDKIKSLGNIRPISLLPSPGKVLEHIVHRWMYEYLIKHSLLSPKQTGFRKILGIHDATIDLISFIHDRFNNKSEVLCIYIDMAKAFNSLDINILLLKLERLGFEGTFLNLLRSYSTERKQVTNFNGNISKSGLVEYGVAQGSVLGPLLFSLYMNELPTIFSVLEIRMYADDTVLFCEVNQSFRHDSTLEQINKELELFSTWCRANYLTVNTSKTKCMLFSVKVDSPVAEKLKDSLLFNGQVLEFVNLYRYLGVELDSKLSMETHVNNITKKVRLLLYSLAKLRHYVNAITSVRTYKTYILPVLEFGLYLVDKPMLIDRMQKLQNKALRICLRESNI